MYTTPIRHRTPNLLEGAAITPLGAIEGIADYVPAGVTQAWDEIRNQVSGVTGSRAFGFAAIGLGAILVWATLSSFGGGKRKYRGKR